ncbi:MAG: hypothetical protein ISP41_07145 [Alphaproteobacteria bacterium]|jgi:hypothetical protein|nr:hypothetical protein [Alphaproteobacteria bacterium]
MYKPTRNALVICLFALLVTACGQLAERRLQTGSIFKQRSGDTNILIGLKAKNLNSLAVLLGKSANYELRFVAYDPKDGLTRKIKWGTDDFAKAFYGVSELDNLTAIKYVAIPVEPGDYVLERINLSDGATTVHSVVFTTDHRKTEFTPSFRVEAKRIAYVGDFTVTRLKGKGLTGRPTKFQYALTFDGHTKGARQFARGRNLNTGSIVDVVFPSLDGNTIYFGKAR